jgi:hypothetical protein
VGPWLVPIAACAQGLGFEWIDPNQTYIKIKVNRTAIYRVAGERVLQPALTMPSGVAVSNLHLYFRGKEVPIYVSAAGDPTVFEVGDYIEFYGQRNDGVEEAQLYRNPETDLPDSSQQPNEGYSMYSDTSAYFLTWNLTPRAPEFTYQDFFNTNYDAYPTAESFTGVSRVNTVSAYTVGPGTYDGFRDQNPSFITGEGYMSPLFSTTSLVVNVPTPFPQTFNAPPAEVRFRAMGFTAVPNHNLRVSVGTITQDFNYTAYTIGNYSFPVPVSALNPNVGAGTPISFNNGGVPQSAHRLAWVEVRYPRLFTFDNEGQAPILYTNNTNAEVTFRIQGMPTTNSSEGVIYDLVGRRRIRGTLNLGEFRAVLPKAAGELQLHAAVEQGILEASEQNLWLSTPRFANLASATNNAQFILIAPRIFAESATAYADYRANAPKKRIATKLVYIDEIYDEFGYGTITPLAIKRFVKAALDRWNTKPEYILLWGKARRVTRRTPNSQTLRGLDCIPTWGGPETEYDFVSNFDPQNPDYIPLVAIGRLNHYNNQHGFDYLDKVKEYESTPYAKWMKKGVHLGGGGNRFQVVKSILTQCQAIFEGKPLQGNVYYSQLQGFTNSINPADDPTNLQVDSGAVQITIVGDGTPFESDVNLRRPNEYQNFGKYPFIHSQGCFKGEYAENVNTTGEVFVREPRRGAIAFLSASGAGFAEPIRRYDTTFFAVAFRDSLGIPVGRAIKETMRRVLTETNGIVSFRNICRQSNLQGDPFITLYAPSLPDLNIEPSFVSFTPGDLNTDFTSALLNLRVENIGVFTPDSFWIRIRHTAPDARINEYRRRVVLRSGDTDTFRFRIDINGTNFAGLNTFDIVVDAENQIPEIDDVTNNRVVVEQLINANAPAIIYPWNYAVINKSEVELVAATFGVSNQPTLRYEFEIDTTYEFTSPQRRSEIVTGTSIQARWKVPFSFVPSSFTQSTVYYWRVRLPDQANPRWARASFKYQPGPVEGWAQTRPPQFFESEPDRLKMNTATRRWEFEPYKVNVSARANAGANATQLYLNDGSLGRHILGDQQANVTGILYCIIDGITLLPRTYEDELGIVSWIQVPSMLPILTNAIAAMKTGDYIVMLGNNCNMAALTPEFYQALGQVGLSQAIRNSPNNDFILLGRKGDAPGSGFEVLAPNSLSQYFLSQNLYSRSGSGRVASTVVGPAKDWFSHYWDWRSLEPSANVDQMTTTISGIDPQGNETLLYPNLPRTIQNDLRASSTFYPIDARRYPRLRLRAAGSDTTLRTAPQLDNWHVLYAPAPDVAVDPFTLLSFRADTLNEGQEAELRIAARLLTETPMDSLLVRLQVRTNNGNPVNLAQTRYRPLAALDTLTIRFAFPTNGLAGDNLLILTLNPDNDQPEANLFNNVYTRRFFIRSDQLNPLLDVTFDGKTIVNGDIVSPNPEIKILINDENPFKLITDPNKFRVYFKDLRLRPDPLEAELVDDPALLEFTPATTADNRAQMVFRPGKFQNLPDGQYALEVQGFDMNNNKSGPTFGQEADQRKRYRITFEVVNEASVTNVLNYPNPFSTNTRFVYTLTGSQIPEVFQLHIYTVTGKFVKLIDLKAAGDVFIGQNISQTSWDGRDEFGDVLANGVYLYKTVVRMPGNAEVKLNQANTSQYFKHGWGKMYILR